MPVGTTDCPVSESMGDIDTIASSHRVATPANCAEYRPDGEGKILKVATRPRDVPTKSPIDE